MILKAVQLQLEFHPLRGLDYEVHVSIETLEPPGNITMNKNLGQAEFKTFFDLIFGLAGEHIEEYLKKLTEQP